MVAASAAVSPSGPLAEESPPPVVVKVWLHVLIIKAMMHRAAACLCSSALAWSIILPTTMSAAKRR